MHCCRSCRDTVNTESFEVVHSKDYRFHLEICLFFTPADTHSTREQSGQMRAVSYLAYLFQSRSSPCLFLLAEAGVRTRVVVVVALRATFRSLTGRLTTDRPRDGRGWKELTENAISTKCRRLGHRRRRRAPPGTVQIRRPQEWNPNVPYCKCHTQVLALGQDSVPLRYPVQQPSSRD